MALLTRSALGSVAGVVLALIPSARAQTSEEIASVVGTVLPALVPPGQHNEHRLRLKAGTYIRIVVEPHNCDLVMAVSELDGDGTSRLRTPYGTRDYITISFLAPQAETVKLAIGTEKGTQTVGSYQIRILEVRPSGPADEKAIQAQRLFIESEALKEGTKQDRERAVENLRSAAATFQSIERANDRGEALRQMGRVLMDLNESPKALQGLNEALALSKAQESTADEASTLNLLGEAEFNLGNTDRSLHDLSRAASMRESLGDLRGQVQSLNNLAVVYGDNGDAAQALQIYTRILPMRIATGNRRGELETILSLQEMYRVLGDISNALDSWHRASELLPSFEDPLLKDEAFLNAGGLYSAIGEKDKALDNYLLALKFARHAGDRQSEGILLQNVANVYLSLGAPEKALVRLEESLSIAKAAKDPRQEARSLEMMASVHHAMNEKQTALDLYTKSLAICISAKDSAWQVLNLNGLGQVEEDLGDWQKAMDYFEKALALVRQIQRPQWEALALANIGHVSAALGDLVKAAAYYEQAYQIADRIGDQERKRRILAGMARLKSESGQLEEARTLIERALAIAEPLRNAVPGSELRSSYFASVQDLFSLQIEILMKLHKSHPEKGYDVLALNASESSRARGLLDRLALKGQIHEGLNPAMMSHERELALEISGKTSRLLRLRLGNSPKLATEIADLKKAIAEKENQYQELEETIRRTSPRFADLAQPKPANFDEIQAQVLDPQSVLMEYSLGEKSSALWVVTSDGLKAFELANRAEIETAARRYYMAVTSRNHLLHSGDAERRAEATEGDQEAREAGLELSQILLNPAARLIAGKRLLIVADGFLNYVPFSALPEPGASDRFWPLANAHQIAMLPSASVLALARQETRNRVLAPKVVAILADPVFGTDDSRVHAGGTPARSLVRPETRDAEVLGAIRTRSAADGSIGLARLPFTRREADRIQGMTNAADSLEALDFRANRDLAIGPQLVNYRIVHFATHGFLDDAIPAWSGLVLSLVDDHGHPRDGFLKLEDIYNLRLNADLVVLSACRTALGKDVRGEGIVGLSRGFMYAGARRVVASLWKVDDSATAEWMTRFYRAMLKDRRTPAEALRTAQVEMSQQTRWAAPYYWAGFVLQGEPN